MIGEYHYEDLEAEEAMTEKPEIMSGSAVDPTPRRPHRRTRPATEQQPDDLPRMRNGEVDQLALMQAQLDDMKRQMGVMPVVAGAPPPRPVWSAGADLTDFQARLREKTRPTPPDFVAGGPSYNFPLRWYARPDGDIVQLQGDPSNLAMYLDLGFHALTKHEVAAWEGGERQKVVKAQREKAALISGIRQLVRLNPTLREGLDDEWDGTLCDMSIAELQDVWRTFTDTIGHPNMKVPTPSSYLARRDAALEARDKRTLAGVETSATVSKEELESKFSRARASGRLQEIR